MASNFEGPDYPDPEFGEGDSRRDQLFSDLDKYLADITEVGGAEAYFAEALERERGASAGDDENSVLVGDDGDKPFGIDTASEVSANNAGTTPTSDIEEESQEAADPFALWEAALHDEPGVVELEDPFAEDHVTEARAAAQADPMDTLRTRAREHIADAAEPAGEAAAVTAIAQQTEAKAIELLDVQHRHGVPYAQALSDVSRYAYEQGDVSSVQAVQAMLQKMPDNGSQSTEYTEISRALASAYFHGLSLGDVESERQLNQLLEREQAVAAEKGGLAKAPTIRGAALIRTAEECVRQDVPAEAYINRHVEDLDGRWAVKFEALKSVALADGTDAVSQQLQDHLRVLTQQEGYTDEFLRTTIPHVLLEAKEPALKAGLLDRYHMVGNYRKEATYENFRQLSWMADILLADDAFMRTHPDDLYYINGHLQQVAETRLHERANTDAAARQNIRRSSDEMEIATMIWGNNSLEVVTREIDARKGAALSALEAEHKQHHSVDDDGLFSEGVRAHIARDAEGQADGMRSMAALQYFKKGNFEACGTILASITDMQTRLDASFALWSEASTEQIVRMTPLEVAVADDPDAPLVELQETALTLASWNAAAIATRFDTLSRAIGEAGDTKQLLNSQIRLQHTQTEHLLARLTRLDPSLAQRVAREHLPIRQAGYIDFKRHRALEPYYQAIAATGEVAAYEEVAGYISSSPDLSAPQKLKQLASYALHLQGVAKSIRTYELPD